MHPDTAPPVLPPHLGVVVLAATLVFAVDKDRASHLTEYEPEAMPKPAVGADLVGRATRRPERPCRRLAKRTLHAVGLQVRGQAQVLDALVCPPDAVDVATVGVRAPPVHVVGGGKLEDEVFLCPLLDLDHTPGVVIDPHREVVDVVLVRVDILELPSASLHDRAGGNVGARRGDVAQPPRLRAQLVRDTASVRRAERRRAATRALRPPGAAAARPLCVLQVLDLVDVLSRRGEEERSRVAVEADIEVVTALARRLAGRLDLAVGLVHERHRYVHADRGVWSNRCVPHRVLHEAEAVVGHEVLGGAAAERDEAVASEGAWRPLPRYG
mmetsp:Transcript_35161/g.101239  ORF Transcript_35161/g.101239 Transcript_35161/m.101239 type:complete len:327 (-) Transcript_35161:957-1937(-)